jgi:hypothetical protein
METDRNDLLMEMFIEEIIKIIDLMALELIVGEVVQHMKVVLRMVFVMEKENGLLEKLNIQETMFKA